MNRVYNVSGVSNSNIWSVQSTRSNSHVHDPIRSPNLSNKYVTIFLTSTYVTAKYDPVLCPNKLKDQQQIAAWRSVLFQQVICNLYFLKEKGYEIRDNVINKDNYSVIKL